MKKEDLELWISKGKSANQIAKENKLCLSTIQYHLKKHNLKTIYADTSKPLFLPIDNIDLEKARPDIVKRGWKYKKSENSSIQGMCVNCKIRKQRKRRKGVFESLCGRCRGEIYSKSTTEEIYKKLKLKRSPHLAFKKDNCERCGFIPEHLIQLEVDHKDGNHNNNDEENLQTLCCNCHRLKSFINKDFNNKKSAGN